MKKQMILRGLLGFPLGIAIGYVITIIISLIWAHGYYSPVIPDLIDYVGSEIYAVILQTFLCGVMGSGFAMASMIWEHEEWSIAKQTGLYFMISAMLMLPIAYVLNWMEHTFMGFITYLSIFIFIFVIVWLTQYFIWKIKIQRLNRGVYHLKKKYTE